MNKPPVNFDIPGLQSIWDEQGPDGLTRINFDIDDDKVDQFFEALGLQSGENLIRNSVKNTQRSSRTAMALCKRPVCVGVSLMETAGMILSTLSALRYKITSITSATNFVRCHKRTLTKSIKLLQLR